MTPKQKAVELFEYMHDCGDTERSTAKKYAIKVVDEILNTNMFYNKHNVPEHYTIEQTIYYWMAVKLEIEDL